MCYKLDVKWIFLSPHLDDVVYSCGGFIWDLSNAGQDIEVWTICAADPPSGSLSPFAASLHRDWGLADNAYQVRRQEDQVALQILGAKHRYLSYLDCIYRQSSDGDFFYDSEEAIFGGLDARESGLIDNLIADLKSELPADARIIAPLGIGNHVDHELTRKAANRLSRSVSFYSDYPYAREAEGREILSFINSSDDWAGENYPISEAGISRWFQASRAYGSQLSIFWEDEVSLEKDIRDFAAFLGGMKVWKTIPEK
jgi:LmbE family N-acetylglucosaminyl deacetylase